MSFYEKIRNFFYAATHFEQLVTENTSLRQQVFDQESEIRRLRDETAVSGGVGSDMDPRSFEQETPEEAIPTIVPAERLPEGWNWVHYDDGSGSLHSPEGEHLFAYDRQPYYASGGIEFRETANDHWTIFVGSMENFKGYAETAVIEKYASREKPTLMADAVYPGDRQSVMAAIERIRANTVPAEPQKERDMCL